MGMRIGLGLSLSSTGGTGGDPAQFTVTLTGLDGTVARIGTELTAVGSGYPGADPVGPTYSWTVAGIEVATIATYTPVAGDDGKTVKCTMTTTEYESAASANSAVQYVAPVAAGALGDVSYAEDTGDQTVDASTDFTGNDITYSVASGIPGVTIDSGTGVVTIPTGITVAAYTVTVTGTNSGGSDASAFGVTITEAITAVVINSVVAGTFSGGALPITITATGATNGDAVTWDIIPDGGGAVLDSGSDVWPGPFSDTLVAGIARQDVTVDVTINNGVASNVESSNVVEVDTVLPVLTDLDAVLNVGDIDVDVTTTKTDDIIYFGLRLAATSQLSKALIKDGGTGVVGRINDGPPLTIDDANGGTFSAGYADGTYEVDAYTVDDYGNQSAVITCDATVVISSSTFAVSRIGGFQYSATTTDTISFTLDLTTAAIGDTVLIVYGPNTYATSMDFGEAALTEVLSSGGNDGAKMSIYKFTVTAIEAGDAALDVDIVAIYAVNSHVITAHLIKNGVIDDQQITPYNAGGVDEDNIAAATPTNTKNYMLSFIIGGDIWTTIGDETWTNAVLIDHEETTTAGTHEISLASQEDVAVGLYSITCTVPLATRSVIATVAISEAP